MRKIGTVAGAVVLVSTAISAASAAADDDVSFRARAQNERYNTNLAHSDSTRVTTETPELGVTSQFWKFKKVAETHEGTGAFTISAESATDMCITDKGSGRPVLLEKCNDANMAQQWFVNTGLEHSTIVSQKNKNEALTAGDGPGQAVSLVEVFGKPTESQLWTFMYPGR